MANFEKAFSCDSESVCTIETDEFYCRLDDESQINSFKMCAHKNTVMRSSTQTQIIFNGSKHIRKHNVNIDVCFVIHSDMMCLEVIAQLKNGIVRKYLDMKLLIARIDMFVINQSFGLKKRLATFQNIKFNAGKVMRSLASEMVVQTLTKRMDLTPQMNDFYFRKLSNDKLSLSPRARMSNKLSFEMSCKPVSLQPFQITPNSPTSPVDLVTTFAEDQNETPLPSLTLSTAALCMTAAASFSEFITTTTLSSVESDDLCYSSSSSSPVSLQQGEMSPISDEMMIVEC
jgi:hypothetical protein